MAKAGEITRGADVEVILVPANDAFEAEWNQVVQGFEDRRARVLAAAQEAERLQAHTSGPAVQHATNPTERNAGWPRS